MMKLLLASSSRYRADLLRKLRLDFATASPNIDETAGPGETPQAQAVRLAVEKARALAAAYPDHLIIGSDQVAILAGKRLQKPGDRQTAIDQLTAACGRSIEFFTAVCVLNSTSGATKTDCDRTVVHVRSLEPAQIERYIDADRPFDCAGSFKSEGLGIALFDRIDTEDPNALIGLPLIRLVRLLEGFGVRVI